MMARLLLADDDSEFLSAAKEFFQRAQMRLETVKNGLAALRQLSVVRFDLAILDVDLSGVRGLELVRTIREKGIDTSFVVLSSNASTSQIVTAMKYGADEFLDKPIDPSTLREVAVSLLAAQDGSPHYLADKVDAFLRENCPRPLHMHDVCEQFKISPSYVSKLFQKSHRNDLSPAPRVSPNPEGQESAQVDGSSRVSDCGQMRVRALSPFQ